MMHICQICKKEFTTIQGLSTHIIHGKKKNYPNHNITVKEYYDRFLRSGEEGLCPTCKCPTSFKTLGVGYAKYCTNLKCRRVSKITQEKIKHTCMDRYGVDNPLSSQEVQEKIKNTCRLKYGTDYALQSEVVKEKRKRTLNDRYGVVNISQLPDVQEKIKKTWMKNYGGHPSQNEDIKLKKKNTCLQNFGVEYPMCSKLVRDKSKETVMRKYGKNHIMEVSIIKEKLKNTMLQRYGVPHFFQTDLFNEKVRKSSLLKYGVDHPLKSDEIKDKIKQTNLDRYGVECYTQSDLYKSQLYHHFFMKLLTTDRLKLKCIPNFTKDDYQGVSHKYSWTCTKCDQTFKDFINSNHIPRCPICYPQSSGFSQMEKDLADYIKSLGIQIIENNRSILNGKELDIYIPYHNLAIEFDGLYWHSELMGVDKNYHLNKTIECQKQGIQLLHIFEDEWLDKQEIIKSIIKSKLGLSERIYARKCQSRVISINEEKDFLNNNHIQGYVPSKYKFGLFISNELVALMTFGSTRFNQHYDIELLRYCSKVGTTVVGGFSKLLALFKTNHPMTSIVTYTDLRFGTGNVYHTLGFSKLSSSSPSYNYLKNGSRINRLQFQKHLLKEKLETFDSNLSEWENMQLNGYDRIWDCGTYVYALEGRNNAI